MSNTHKHTVLSYLNASLVLAGLGLLSAGSKHTLRAQLWPQSGQGALAGQAPEVAVGRHELWQGVAHAAAPAAADLGPLLLLGMLLILLGCFLHALLVLKNERPLPVQMKRKIGREDTNVIQEYLEIFWIRRR